MPTHEYWEKIGPTLCRKVTNLLLAVNINESPPLRYIVFLLHFHFGWKYRPSLASCEPVPC